MCNATRSRLRLLLVGVMILVAGDAFSGPATLNPILDTGLYQAPDGTLFSYIKTREEGTTFQAGDLRLTADELRAWEAAHGRPVVDPRLLQAADGLDPETPLSLTVFLEKQPAVQIARQVRARYQAELDGFGRSIQEVQRSLRPTASLAPAEELAMAAGLATQESLLSPMQLTVVRSVAAQAEALGETMRREIRERVAVELDPEQQALALKVEELAGIVTGRTQLLSALTVTLPAGSLAELAADPRVVRIEALAAGTPELDLQGASLGLTTGFWAQGLTGGTWDAGVLDTGVQQNHPALNPASWLSMAGTADGDGHGTGVAGIILSDDATFRGMAYGLDTMLVGSASGGTVMNHADWMVSTAAEDPEAINLSFGYGRANDVDYSSFDQFFDGLVDGAGALLAKSAGNSGDGTTTITHPASAYNILAVANMDDQNTETRDDDALRSTSSRGPTLAGRKKPDITAPGHNTMTTNNAWATGADFVNFTGTSAAAPHVVGAALLVTEILGARNPMATKAVLINTADSFTDSGTSGNLGDDGPVVGSEWNKTYGWGYLDLLEAWVNGTDVFTGFLDAPVARAAQPPTVPNVKLYKGEMLTGEKATLVWNRHVAYNGSATPTLVEDLSDLDLYAYDHGDGAHVVSSTSLIDNVEQISVPEFNEYVLKVAAAGSFDPDVTVEPFALATEEQFEEGSPPVLEILVGEDPIVASPGQLFELGGGILNTSTNLRAFETSVQLTVPPDFTLESGKPSEDTGTLFWGGGAFLYWQVRAACALGSFTYGLAGTSASYGEIYSASLQQDLEVDVAPLVPGVLTIGRVAPRTYEFPVKGTSWTGVGVDGDGDNKDLFADDALCLPTPYQSSTAPGDDQPDLILVNGRTFGTGTHYALVDDPAIFDYRVEAEHATAIPAPLQGTTTASGSFDGDDILDVFEISLAAGNLYFLEVTPTSGLDVSVFGFLPGRAAGSRTDADFAAGFSENGGPVGITIPAPESGWYGVAVVNDDGLDVGTYEITVRNGIFADGFESGDAGAWSSIISGGAGPVAVQESDL